jgi:hypothetical protein
VKRLFKNIIFLFLAIIPIASFAFKPAPSYISRCQSMQHRLTHIFHDSVKEYNLETNSSLDAESPTLTVQTALQFLKDYGYTDERLYKVTSKCELDLKFFKDGIKDYSNYKNVFYCKFHGSEVCGIKSSYPNELSEESAAYERSRQLSIFLYGSKEFILIGLIILIAVVVTKLASPKKKKKLN